MFLCYRNSLLVVLLHSARILQWIRHRYIPQLDKTDLGNYSYIEQPKNVPGYGRAVPGYRHCKSVSEIDYTDVLCELYYLSEVYWSGSGQFNLDEAMNAFWEYLLIQHHRHKSDKRYPAWEFTGQQDAAALLRWMFQMARVQRLSLIEGREMPNLPPEEREKLEPLRNLDIENIVGFKMTRRMNCVYCNRTSHTKRRISKLEEDIIWSFPVLILVEGKNKHKTNVNLYDCMRRNLKSELDDAACEACREKSRTIEEEFKADMDKIKKTVSQRGQASALDKARARRDKKLYSMTNYEGHIWNKIAKLPEVLFLSLTRLLPGDDTKQPVTVQIPQELDLRAMVEHRIPLPEETKYRIVGIVNHCGVMNGGHYIAHTFMGGKWTEFNDHRVSPTEMRDIIESQGQKVNKAFTPYLIMYEKIPLFETEQEGGEDEDAMKKSLENGGSGNGNGADGADGRGDGSPTISSNAPVCIQPGSISALQVAKAIEPGFNQGHVAVKVKINSTIITFPTYLIENHSNFNVNLGEIELTLTDSSLHSILLSAKQSNQLASVESRKRSSEEVESDGDDIDNSSSGSKRQKSNSLASDLLRVNSSPRSNRQQSNSPVSNPRRTSPNVNRSTPSHQPSNQQADGVAVRRSRSKSAQSPAKDQSPKPKVNPSGYSQTDTIIPGLGNEGTDAGQNASNNNDDDEDEDSLFNGSPTAPNPEENEQDQGGEKEDEDWELVPKSPPIKLRSSPRNRGEASVADSRRTKSLTPKG